MIREAIRKVALFVLRNKAYRLFLVEDEKTGLWSFNSFGRWVYLGGQK